MDASYKQNEMTIYKITIQLEQLIKRERPNRAEEWLRRLGDIQQQIQTRKFRMAVVGEFNRGKSSFINVLLGKRILPEDVLATTATINRVTYGEKPKAYIVFRDGSRGREEIPVEELAAYITKLTAEASANASQIKEAVLEYPTMLCYDDVDLIDTPGMNDVDDMNEVTVNQLENIDLAVVAINAQYPYSETENRFVVKLLESPKVCQIIFVVTYFDMIRPRERAKLMGFLRSRIPENVLRELQKRYPTDDDIFRKYHSIFDDIHIYGVSSRDAMDALEDNDMELFESSGFLKLRNELPQEILSSRSVSMLENFLALLLEIITEYHKDLRKNGEILANWQTVRGKLSDIFDDGILELAEKANEIYQNFTIDDQKKTAVDGLLASLGAITAMTPDNVQKVMLPVMQGLYAQINEELQAKNERMLQQVYQQWVNAINQLIIRTNTILGKYPELKRELSSELERLNQFSGTFLEEQFKCHMEALHTQLESRFYWSESPIQIVLQTEVNKSVLPGLRQIVDLSAKDYLVRNRKMLDTEFSKAQALLRQQLNAFLERMDQSRFMKATADVSNDNLISELQTLHQECNAVYQRVSGKEAL